MAEDGKTTESRPVDTVKVAVIGTGDASRLDSGVVAVTPGQHQPNLVTQVVTPLMALAVRFGYAWCTAFVGGVTTAGLLSGKLNQTEAVPIIELAALFAT